MTRIIVIIIILASFGYAGWWTVDRIREATAEEEVASIRTDTAEIRDIEEVVEASGEVRPELETVVKSEVSGMIEEILVEEGEQVEAGMPLIRIDQANLQARLDEASRDLQAFQLRVERARRNYKRLKALQERDFGRESALLDAKTDLDLALIDLQIRETRVEDARENLSKTIITAPHDGVVIDLVVNEGSVINGVSGNSAGTELLKVADMGAMFLEVNINEIDVHKLETGDSVRLSFEALPGETIQGKILRIAPSATRSGNRRVFPIKVGFETNDRRIRPGISANVEVSISEVLEAVSINISAIFVEDEQSYVYAEVGDSLFEKRKIEVGINDNMYAVVESGLEVGEAVALGRPAEEQLASEA
jgi:HlyD family secretion protein